MKPYMSLQQSKFLKKDIKPYRFIKLTKKKIYNSAEKMSVIYCHPETQLQATLEELLTTKHPNNNG